MFCQADFDQWRTTIMDHLSPLSKPQATVLAMWSLGIVLARSCALRAVSPLLATGRRRKEQTVRQQLRAWYDAVPRKRGTTRHALRVATCCAPLVGWVGSAGGRARNGRWPLLRQLRPAVPQGWTVIVLADRGLYAPWRLRRITRLGGRPLCASTRAAPVGQPAPPAGAP